MFEHLTPKAKGAAEALEIALMESPPSIEFVADKAKELLDALGETPWRPIDEAPKDGPWIMVAIAGPTYHPEKVKWDGFRWVVHYGRQSVIAIDTEPTHWMPLPAPPTEAQP